MNPGLFSLFCLRASLKAIRRTAVLIARTKD